MCPVLSFLFSRGFPLGAGSPMGNLLVAGKAGQWVTRTRASWPRLACAFSKRHQQVQLVFGEGKENMATRCLCFIFFFLYLHKSYCHCPSLIKARNYCFSNRIVQTTKPDSPSKRCSKIHVPGLQAAPIGSKSRSLEPETDIFMCSKL